MGTEWGQKRREALIKGLPEGEPKHRRKRSGSKKPWYFEYRSYNYEHRKGCFKFDWRKFQKYETKEDRDQAFQAVCAKEARNAYPCFEYRLPEGEESGEKLQDSPSSPPVPEGNG